jgi:hypothetical protein
MYAARAADGSLPTCPVPRMPGTPFPCGDGGLTCTAGESACRTSFDQRTGATEHACSDLCPAADCSCYCEVDSFGGCGFDPPDAESPEDGCTCGPDLGTVNVVCAYYGPTIPEVCERDPESDSQCPNADIRGTVYRCVSLPGDTMAAPRLPCDLLVGINETIWWCCGSY